MYHSEVILKMYYQMDCFSFILFVYKPFVKIKVFACRRFFKDIYLYIFQPGDYLTGKYLTQILI